MNHDVLKVRIEQAVSNLRLASVEADERSLPIVAAKCRMMADDLDATLLDTVPTPERGAYTATRSKGWPTFPIKRVVRALCDD